MRKLHVGCGNKYKEGYEHLDKFVDADFIDYKCDVKDILVPDNTYDEIYARHWLEHLYYYNAVEVLTILSDKLKKGGFIHLIIPNLEFHAKQLFLDGNSKFVTKSSNFNHAIAGFYGWVGKNKEYMAHKHGYTRESLYKLIQGLYLRPVHIKCRECDLEIKGYKL